MGVTTTAPKRFVLKGVMTNCWTYDGRFKWMQTGESGHMVDFWLLRQAVEICGSTILAPFRSK